MSCFINSHMLEACSYSNRRMPCLPSREKILHTQVVKAKIMLLGHLSVMELPRVFCLPCEAKE